MLDCDAPPVFFNPDINSCWEGVCVKAMMSSQPFVHMFAVSDIDTLKLSVTVVLHSTRLLFFHLKPKSKMYLTPPKWTVKMLYHVAREKTIEITG